MKKEDYIIKLNESREGIFDLFFNKLGASDLKVIDKDRNIIVETYKGDNIREIDFRYKMYGYTIIDIYELELELSGDDYWFLVVK